MLISHLSGKEMCLMYTQSLLQLNVTANWGSTGKIAEGIGKAAMMRGWESTIAYGRYMNFSKSHLIKVGNKFDIYAHYARNRFFDGEGLGCKRATQQLIKHIISLHPDIIHLHNIHDHWLNYPILFEYLASIKTPIVWTFHDCWAFTGGCPYFEIPPCDKWKYECFECPLRKNKIDRSAIQFKKRKELIASLSNRLTIVPVSNWLEDFCRESILKNCKIQLIHNGIDTETFNILDNRNSKPLILGVAIVWDYRKGLGDFIKLRQLIPDNEADIVLIGLKENQIKALPRGITGLAKTQNMNELVRYYNNASVLVNPTYADNFPTVNLEALACGTPVVTYRTGGSPEAVNEITGKVIETGNINALANSIKEILHNPNHYSRDACRARAVQYFNKDTQFGKYVDLYEELINKTR